MRRFFVAAMIGCSTIALAQTQPIPKPAVGEVAAADTTITAEEARGDKPSTSPASSMKPTSSPILQNDIRQCCERMWRAAPIITSIPAALLPIGSPKVFVRYLPTGTFE